MLYSAGFQQRRGTPAPVQMFSKAFELWREGTVQPLICAAVCGEDVRARPCDGTVALSPRSLKQPHPHPQPPFQPYSPRPCPDTMDTKGSGRYSDGRSIHPLAGPWSPHVLVNHLPNNEAQYPPSSRSSLLAPLSSLLSSQLLVPPGTFSPPVNVLITSS